MKKSMAHFERDVQHKNSNLFVFQHILYNITI